MFQLLMELSRNVRSLLVALYCNILNLCFVIRTMLQFYAKLIPPILCTASAIFTCYRIVLVNTTEMSREYINIQSLFQQHMSSGLPFCIIAVDISLHALILCKHLSDIVNNILLIFIFYFNCSAKVQSFLCNYTQFALPKL